jgi:predicted choloylglycine hydrolase
MFPTANVFQEAWRMQIHVPDSVASPGLLPVVCGASPGMVGCPVALNARGVAMGVDVVVTSDVAIEMPSAGLNSLLLVRHVTDNAHDLRSGVDLVVEAHRGCSWLYPLCDGKGDCAVLETGMYMESYPNALDYVINPNELPYLPNQSFIDAHSAEYLWEKGVFKRFMNYSYPTEYLDYNEGLFGFKHATRDYNTTAGAWGPNGYVWTDWDLEHQATTHLGADYFPPQRETYDDVVMVTNHNLIPEAHITRWASPESGP